MVELQVPSSGASAEDANRAAEAGDRRGEGTAPSHPCPGLAVQLRVDGRRSDAMVAQDRSQLRRGAVAVLAVVERIHSLHRTFT